MSFANNFHFSGAPVQLGGGTSSFYMGAPGTPAAQGATGQQSVYMGGTPASGGGGGATAPRPATPSSAAGGGNQSVYMGSTPGGGGGTAASVYLGK